MKRIFVIATFLISLNSFSQKIAAYLDNNKHLIVFDDGTAKELEYNPIKKFNVSPDFIVYVNYDNILKVYYKGQITTLEEVIIPDYKTTNSYIVYQVNRRLKIFDAGQQKILSEWCDEYIATDSMIVFKDHESQSLKIYENGETKTIVEGKSSYQFRSYKTGNNFVAFIDMDFNFKVYHKGSFHLIESDFKGSYNTYPTGNILLYTDEMNQNLNAFYNEKIYPLDEYGSWINFGYDYVIYKDYNNNRHLFYKGVSKEIDPLTEIISVSDRILVFSDNKKLKVIFDGVLYELENYIPEVKGVSRTSILYLTTGNKAKVFFRGKIYDNITPEIITEYQGVNDIYVLSYGLYSTRVFYEGKLY